MTTDELIRHIRAMAGSKFAFEKRILTEAADELEKMDERIDIMAASMDETWGKG